MDTENSFASAGSRFLAFAVDCIIYGAIFYGLGGMGHFLAMIYILFRDGLFGGQSVGKKIMGIEAIRFDGGRVNFVDSSFRNILFIFYLLFPFAAIVEGFFILINPENLRLGDRIAKTAVVRKTPVEVPTAA